MARYKTPLGELTKLEDRKFNQYEADVVYRFGAREKFYVGAKYNKIDGTLSLGQNTNTANLIRVQETTLL